MQNFINFKVIRCVIILAVIVCCQPSFAAENESDLLVVLNSDAHPSEKALACKNLAIYGSAAAVPDLAKLLPNPQLSSWSRIALEAIPGEESNAALRKAANALQGRLLIGVINSIGFRRDEKAVGLLIEKLKDEDTEVGSAAAIALGHIGTPAATTALRNTLAGASAGLKSAIAEGCVLSAERLHDGGESAKAVAIYDEVRKAHVPQQRKIEATRGAILARKQDGIPLLLETFRSTDKKMFQLALGTVREFPGGEVDKALAAELSGSSPNRAMLIVQAMADRPATVSLPAVLDAAKSGNKLVRLSAIEALQRVGDDTCLSTLLQISSDSDADLASAAQKTVAELPGKRVDEQIKSLLTEASGDRRSALLKLIGQRRIDAVDEVVKSLKSSDRSVRAAALVALGETVSLGQMGVLVSQAVKPSHAEDAEVAKLALKAASVRMPDQNACTEQLAKAMSRSGSAAKTTLLEIIAEVGGPKALETLASSAKSADSQLQDAGSRLLGRWNNVAAAPVLLDLAKTGSAEKYRVRALRGYLGLARKFAMPDEQRADMCQNAIDATNRVSEHKLALDVLRLRPSAQGLNIAMKAMKNPQLKAEAQNAAMVIAQKVGVKGTDVSKWLAQAGLDKVKLEIVKAEYGVTGRQKDVTAVLKKQNSGIPLLTLESGGYNASFGGDPAPGVPKKLKVQYRINGKAGEASFSENALILLPMPK